MLTVAIALAVLAAIVAVVVVRARLRKPKAAEPSVAPIKSKPVPDRHSAAKPAASNEEFDPEATQVYLRPPVDTAPRQRAGATGPLAGAQLVGLSGSHKGTTFPITATGTTIGRNASCDIILSDPRVSSHHAWIGLVSGKAVLRDLQSTNGTFLNAQTHTSVSEAELRPGDTIFFGGHQGDQFRFVAD